jgi:hypothetical protein
MEFYDAHVHFLWEGEQEQAVKPWQTMKNDGLKGMAAIIMGYHLKDQDRCLSLIPTSYHNQLDRSFFDTYPSLDSCVPERLDGLELFPYLDSRYIEEPQADLTQFREAGFRGLKVLYVPEEDRENGMLGWRNLFGRSMRASEDLTARLVEQAAGYGWPVIFHADLRRYGDFVEDLLGSFLKTSFVVPHFGFSRKAVTRLIERLENVSTDFSSLLPFMKKSPDAYSDFLNVFPERVLFGSDATISLPSFTEQYFRFITELISDQDVLRRVLSENYLKIHEKGTPKSAG